MNAMQTLSAVLGWCALINLGLLALSTVCLVTCRGWISGMHGKLFGMDETALSAAYFRYLATFKIVVIVFNVVPWIALQIVT